MTVWVTVLVSVVGGAVVVGVGVSVAVTVVVSVAGAVTVSVATGGASVTTVVPPLRERWVAGAAVVVLGAGAADELVVLTDDGAE
ncbi:hypothetical protein [Mycobacterium sp. URHB0021]